MDMNIKAPKRTEIQQFLLDVRAHFRTAVNNTPQYENTTNLLHVTPAEQTHELLERCDKLLAGYTDEQAAAAPVAATAATSAVAATTSAVATTGTGTGTKTAASSATSTTTICDGDQVAAIKSNGVDNNNKVGAETGCYQEMAASPSSTSRHSLSTSREYMDVGNSQATRHTDKALEPSSEQDHDQQQLYDTCQHQGATADETQQVFAHELFINCPFATLPAGHMALQRPTKYGQLLRIEKRLFFDQTKKFYCGILNDWLLCYSDGPTSTRPSSSLYLKSSAIEVEHFGEGKRRELCFQITTADPSKKLMYQASNEVDAKEWIHAIEAAIRGDAILHSPFKSVRKLPTPPLTRKSSYMSAISVTDSIYEEPSPIYNLGDATTTTPPILPEKCNSAGALAKRFDYDIPKCPPQPLAIQEEEPEPANAEVETAELLNGNGNVSHETDIETSLHDLKPQASSLHGNRVMDFQTNLKTVHSELSSQLTSPERLKKAIKKSYSCGNSEPEMLSLTNPQPTALTASKEQKQKELKKQRKSSQTTPQTSPQKPQSSSKDNCDKLARNWFLSRLNKTSTGQSNRLANGGGSNGVPTGTPTNAKCKQSEKENLLNGLDLCDGGSSSYDPTLNEQQTTSSSSNPTSPCLKSDSNSPTTKSSKVNMIINQFESSGHLSTMFSVEALAANALASLTSFCESDNNCNNYEPIMPLATTPNSFLKKV